MNDTTLLLVEDDADIQESLRYFLEHEGFKVYSAFNGQEALDYLRAGNQVSLILLDLMMPVVDGYEFLSQFRADSVLNPTPVVVVSAVRDLSRIARELGVLCVPKPIDLDLLTETIQKVMVNPPASRA